jgi:regulator of replication initiation timing
VCLTWTQERDALAASDRAALDKVSRLHEEGSKVITALQTEVQRLTEENVHLVGHTNLKQKIQMHAKVKDENQKQKVCMRLDLQPRRGLFSYIDPAGCSCEA